MAAARDRRRRIRGKRTQTRTLCVLFWGAVWLWFGARTLRAAGRILACRGVYFMPGKSPPCRILTLAERKSKSFFGQESTDGFRQTQPRNTGGVEE